MHATLDEIVAGVASQLSDAGCPAPGADAMELVAAAIGTPPGHLRASLETPTVEALGRIRSLARRRAGREPLAYILGTVRFRGLELHVNPRVHIPRDDRSGLLVNVALELPFGSSVHDVGTGCGAIAIAIKTERPDLVVSASDISAEALEVARENAVHEDADIAFTCTPGLPKERYDLVVACLPYAVEATLEATHPPETALHQPRIALVAGADGLDAIRRLVAEAPAGQALALEHAPDQAAAVRGLLARARTLDDAAALERVTTGKLPARARSASA